MATLSRCAWAKPDAHCATNDARSQSVGMHHLDSQLDAQKIFSATWCGAEWAARCLRPFRPIATASPVGLASTEKPCRIFLRTKTCVSLRALAALFIPLFLASRRQSVAAIRGAKSSEPFTGIWSGGVDRSCVKSPALSADSTFHPAPNQPRAGTPRLYHFSTQNLKKSLGFAAP